MKARTIPAWQVLLLGPLGAMLFLTLGSLVLGFATMYFPGPDSINVVTIAYVVGIAHSNAVLTTPLYMAFVLLLVVTMLWGTGRWVTPALIIAPVGAALSLVVHYMTAAPNTSFECWMSSRQQPLHCQLWAPKCISCHTRGLPKTRRWSPTQPSDILTV